MRKGLLLIIVILTLRGSTLTLADHPDPLPDTRTTPNFNYTVHYTNDNPYDPNNVQPGDDLNYFPDSQAQVMADALDNNNAPTPGNPNGYHSGYTNLGFLAPVFPDPFSNTGGVIPPQVGVFDCSAQGHGNCGPSGAAGTGDGIRMPSTVYIQAPEIEIRRVIGHELFHHVQMAYIGPNTPQVSVAWSQMSIEGTARLMEDKVYSDIDGDPDSKYMRTVNGFVDIGGNPRPGSLDIPNFTLWTHAYGAALFWNYLTEQLGTINTEPQIGVDFIRTFWENAQANSANPDLVATLRQTIRQFDTNATLEGLFHDFNIANYAKDLDVSGLGADAAKYRYVDENDGTGLSYQSVAVASTDTVPPAVTRNDTGDAIPDVVRWGGKYHEANISLDCNGVVGFRSQGDTAAYGLLAIKSGATFGDPDRVVRLYKGVTDHFARALVQDPADPYIRLVAVVAGLDDPADYTYTFDCGPAVLQIKDPTKTNPAYVGEPNSPDRFLVRLNVTGPASLGTPSVEGLDPFDFNVFVGPQSAANRAPVVSGAYVQGEYWLVVQPQDKPAAGTFPLTVKLGAASATEQDAVVYGRLVLDQVLVIDRSGSMLSPAGAPKIDAAKSAAGLFVDAARSGDKLGVVSFNGDGNEPNDDATLDVQLQDVTDAHRTTAKNAIQALAAGGFTSIGDGLQKGADEFPVRGSTLGEDWLVLLSDGMQNEALFWNNVQTAIQNAGIKVNAIALGPQTDQALLQAIANDTGGIYYYVDVPPGFALTNATLSATAAADDLPNRLSDAYALAAERIQRHERLWEAQDTVAQGITVTHLITIEQGGITDGLFAFNWTDPAETLRVEIRRPDGSVVQDGVAGARVFSAATHVVARVGDITPGTWQVTLQGDAGSPDYLAILSGKDQQGPSLGLYFAQYAGDRFLRHINGLFMRGLPMPILATLTDSKGPVIGADVVAWVEHPDGTTLELPLLDDGNHGDGNANDGIYGNLYTRTTAVSQSDLPDDPTTSPARGSYNVRVEAQGRGRFGNPFRRIRKGAFQIFEGPSELEPDPDVDKDGMPNRYELLHPCLDDQVYDEGGDPDMDGIKNVVEYDQGTDPCSPDTDRGGESDLSERNRGANPFDPRDDALPRPIDVEVIGWVPDHLPRPDLQPNSNLIRYPVNPTYNLVRLMRSTSPSGPFTQVAEFGAQANGGLYRDAGLTNGTTYYYRLLGVDLNGNTSAPSHIFSGTPRSDPFPPLGHVSINNDQPYTDSSNVTLQLEADEDTTEVLIANHSSFEGANWQAYTPTMPWTLDPDPNTGYAAVYVQYRDLAGNHSRVYSDGIIVQPAGSLGAITGRVTLPGQTDHAGVFVRVTNDPQVTPAFTDASGNFLLSGLLPGSYNLRLERTGYLPQAVGDVVVNAGGVTDIGAVTLQPTVPPACNPVVSGDQAGEGGTTHAMSYDGNTATFFNSTHDNWQHIQIDFNCVGTFSALRRYMTRDGTDTSGHRGLQGEGVTYSLDGTTWTELTGDTTHGWEAYTDYGARNQAWHSVNYGWSAWLNLNTPVQARYVRFKWDDNHDALNEIELLFTAPTTCYDFELPTGVGVEDIQAVAGRWRQQSTDESWDDRFDLDGNRKMDIADIMRVAAVWGGTCL